MTSSISTDHDTFVRELFSHVDAADFDWVEANLDPECRIEAPGFSQVGPEMVTIWMAGFFAAFPDLRHHVLSTVSQGDQVAAQLEVTGTHTADLLMLDGTVVSPTGRSIKVRLGEFWTLRGGRVAEYRVIYDQNELAVQLGLLPEPADG
jgi:predicted ester cyclase